LSKSIDQVYSENIKRISQAKACSLKTPRGTLLLLNYLLLKKKLRIDEFAQLLGFTKSHGGYLLKGTRSISVTLLMEIADKLGVSPASLIPEKKGLPSFQELIDTSLNHDLDERIDKLIEKKLEKLRLFSNR